MHTGQKTGAPDTFAGGRVGATRDQHHESRQVAVGRPQPVAGPGSHRRIARTVVTSVNEQLGGGVVELLGGHRTDDRQLVGDGVQVRHHAGDHLARLAAWREFKGRPKQCGVPLDEGKTLAGQHAVRAGLQMMFLEIWFIVEQVLLRWRP